MVQTTIQNRYKFGKTLIFIQQTVAYGQKLLEVARNISSGGQNEITFSLPPTRIFHENPKVKRVSDILIFDPTY